MTLSKAPLRLALLLSSSLVLSVALGSVLSAQTTETLPAPPTMHDLLVAKKGQGHIQVYFEGDSITRRWGGPDYPEFLEHWRQTFTGWDAGNFGVGGDTTAKMLWRLEHGEFEGLTPKVIVLLAGTNDVGRTPTSETEEQTVQGIRRLLDYFTAHAPQATIVLHAIFPRNDSPLSNPVIQKINRRIADFADGKRIRFLDLSSLLADENGKLHEGVTVDQLHLSVAGYKIWAGALTPLLTELLGPKATTDHAPPATVPPPSAPPAKDPKSKDTSKH